MTLRCFSASARSRSPRLRLAGTTLDARPTAPHLLDRSFTRWIAWCRPLPRARECIDRRERLGDRLLWLWPLLTYELSGTDSRGSVALPHARDRIHQTPRYQTICGGAASRYSKVTGDLRSWMGIVAHAVDVVERVTLIVSGGTSSGAVDGRVSVIV